MDTGLTSMMGLPGMRGRKFLNLLSPLGGASKPVLAAFDPSHKGVGITLSNNNLTATNTGGGTGWQNAVGVIYKSTGKYYDEVTVGISTALSVIGLVNSLAPVSNAGSAFPGVDLNGVGYTNDGRVLINSANIASGLPTWTSGAVLGRAVDLINKKIWFRVGSGGWLGGTLAAQNPATNTGGIPLSTLNVGPYAPVVSADAVGDGSTDNFGGSVFSQTAPVGFGNWQGASATTNPMFLPAGASAVYSVRRLSTYLVNKCVDVVDSTSVTTTIGWVNDFCDFATIAALPQPVVISKVYDQSNSFHDAVAGSPNQPSINGSVAQAFLIDGLVANGGGSNAILKQLVIPAGVSFNENAFSVFMAAAPKTSIWNDGFFNFNTTLPFENMFTFQDTSANAAGNLQGITGGGTPVQSFTTTNIPAINGTVIGIIGNGTVGTAIIDGATAPFTVASQALTGGVIGTLEGVSGGFAGSFNMFGFAFYPSVLSSPNQAAVQAAFNSLMSIPASYSGQVLCDGDSITYGYGGTLNRSWTRTLAAAFPAYKTYSLGVPGQQISTMATVASSRVAARFNAGLTKNILTLWAGTNDIIGGASAATAFANLQSETATAKAAGFKVVWVTMLPRSDLTSITSGVAIWNAYNALIRGATLGQSNTADVIADVQSDLTMGPFAATADHTLYLNVPPADFSIGVHPTDLGNSIIAPIIIAAVSSL